MATNKEAKTILKIQLPAEVGKIITRFQKANQQIYLVGGAVRDYFLKRPIHDWDLATDAPPATILKLFPKTSFYNNQFGTVTIPLKTDKVEITPFRRESHYRDFRHPAKISWGKTINEDLARRDFTINAMALEPQPNSAFRLIDPFQGRYDLEKKLIRAVGKAEQRFQEDALRLIRAIRFSAQLGFLIEEKTFQAIKKNAALIKKVSRERLRDELLRLLASPFPAEGINFLHTSGLLTFLIPELEATYGIKQAKHHIDDVWTHSLKTLANCPNPDPIVRFAALIHDIGKPLTAKGEGANRTFYNHEIVGAKIASRLSHRFRLSKKDSQRLWRLVRWHQFTMDEHQTDKAIRRFIRHVGQENLAAMLDLRTADRLGSGVRATSWRFELFKKKLAAVQKQPFSLKDLKINGHDVMQHLKISPGPLVGQILKHLFQEVVDKKVVNKREELLSRITPIYRNLRRHVSTPPKEEQP